MALHRLAFNPKLNHGWSVRRSVLVVRGTGGRPGDVLSGCHWQAADRCRLLREKTFLRKLDVVRIQFDADIVPATLERHCPVVPLPLNGSSMFRPADGLEKKNAGNNL